MANTSSAKKAIRVTERKTVINLRAKRAFKQSRKNVLKAILDDSNTNTAELLSDAFKKIDKAAKRNIIHKNTAARYKSSLSKAVAGK
jgi:small subunit ribosomal protein S20